MNFSLTLGLSTSAATFRHEHPRHGGALRRDGHRTKARPFRRDQYVSSEIRPQGCAKVTKSSLEPQASLREARRAPPVGRALRILLGLVLMVYVTPVYFKIPVPLAVRSLLLMLGLVGVYSLIHIVVSRRIATFGPCVGAAVANGVLVAVYVAGGPGSLILGRGEGALAAVTFLGTSLIIAGVGAAPGCEVMAIPGLLFGKHTELGCLIFSPLDRLERKLRSKHGNQ